MDNNFDAILNVSAVPQDDRVAAFIAESRNNRSHSGSTWTCRAALTVIQPIMPC